MVRSGFNVIVFEQRASTILFNVLRARGDSRPFLLPGNVCQIVADTYAAAGQSFEFVDIYEPELALDPDQCVAHLKTGEYAGVHFVRSYGSERDATPFFAAMRAVRPDLLLIDDKCLCRPECDGELLPWAGDVTLFSTGRAKFTDIEGGGFAYLRPDVAYRRERNGPDWLFPEASQHPWAEYRSRTQVATRAAIAQKRELNSIYSSVIPAEVQYPSELQQWRFNIRVPDSEGLVANIFNAGLFASRHYAPLGLCPVAAKVQATVVNLFNDRYFSADQARRAAEIVAQHVASTGVLSRS